MEGFNCFLKRGLRLVLTPFFDERNQVLVATFLENVGEKLSEILYSL